MAHGLFWLARGERLSHWLRGAACHEEALSPSAVLSLGLEDPGNELLVFSWDERCLIKTKQTDKSSLLSPLEAATLPDWNSLSSAELGTARMQVTSSVLLVLSSLEVGG